MQLNGEILKWLELLLHERLGLKVTLEIEGDYFRLNHESYSTSIFIGPIDEEFFKIESRLHCYKWDSSSEGYTSVLNGSMYAPSSRPIKSKIINERDNNLVIEYDLLGLSFWMFNRLEEIDSTKKRDSFDRFPATESHAFINGYLDRPIVDEWFEILKQVVLRLWRNELLKKREFKISATHDVDRPSMYAFKSWREILYLMGSHLKHGRYAEFFKAPLVKISTINKFSDLDSFNTFDWLMDQSEKNGLKSTFYFICGSTDRDKDADYGIEHPLIKKLLKDINDRGHEIGLHPSFNSYLSLQQITFELNNLKTACQKLGIEQKEWGVRMHYLKWSHPTTLSFLNSAGFSYDSTLGYHDMPGFRCGTCVDYRAFDPLENKILNIRVKPLILMESSLVGGVYGKVASSSEISRTINYYKEICQKLNGDFVLLWHNSSFLKSEYFKIYSKILGQD